MDSSGLESLITECDLLIRSGRMVDARTKLTSLNTAQIPREHRQPLANLCRRLNLIHLGLRVLTPLIYPEKSGKLLRSEESRATGAERAEYAILLQRYGSTEEAISILTKIDPREHVDALLFQAFCLFSRWEYAQAIDILELFLTIQQNPYPRLIGKVNLAAALIACDRYSSAFVLIDDILSDARSQGARRLLGNALELRGQALTVQGEFAAARLSLDEAAKITTGDGGTGELAIIKWRAVIEARETGVSGPLDAFRNEARARRDWEGVRDADFQILRVCFSEKLFEHLLFGSPWPMYRDRVQRVLQRVLQKEMIITPPLGMAENGRLLDLTSGELDDRVSFAKGGKLHQTLGFLWRDFYRPSRLGAIFAELFPDERFDIFSSPNRVHQIIHRVRDWIHQENLPIVISQGSGLYAMQISGDLAIRSRYERRSSKPDNVFVAKLRELYSKGQSFTAREAAEGLALSLSSIRKLLANAVSRGDVEKTGAGNGTLYVVQKY